MATRQFVVVALVCRWVWIDQARGNGGVISVTDKPTTLREYLRAQTRQAHDTLDAAMSRGGWTTQAGYVRFLQIQHAARSPIERWMDGRMPSHLRPPLQSHLIEQDLARLGASASENLGKFDSPEEAGLIGIAWALAGSSLGNAMILKGIAKASGSAKLPTAFLSDPSMNAFWKSLLPELKQAAAAPLAEAANCGALAVFDHFLRAVQSHDAMHAAGRIAA